ncbi:hypothetical protein SAMN05661008_01485 [Alkalithermobacter thermoalcaliphilus JW-YL-7 = DSM 7308]|uniref:Flagellar hook-length control protein-like protein n=1 Tax=Alkalithermobacter thermoalcaliphilus JW-YL-7 = DSM 7308 TaxID=1121328 RepID=A0A150FSB0_CLOPD|nr:hypothetical protein JWYL7_1130 [[Clostridium] paradoxum JW-YL-7 = DSM 7308]SHL12097.1 hypothetical protein SAMN05661008_01485 [[Clostridium] paradoxum JW-YL-7 = DSM 7308]
MKITNYNLILENIKSEIIDIKSEKRDDSTINKNQIKEDITLKIEQTIKELNIPNTSENKQIIKEMIEQEITVNNENFKIIKENLSSYKALLNFTEKEVEILNQNIENIQDKEIRELLKDIYINKNGKNLLTILSDIKDMDLDQTDFIFLFKNNLKLNYNNIKNMDEFFKKGDNLEKILDKLYKIVSSKEGNAKVELNTIIKKITTDISKNANLNLEKIKHELNTLTKKISDSKNTYTNLNKDLENINEKLNFLNKLTNESMYFQVPFTYNDYKNLAQIIIKHKQNKSKKVKDDISIFVSLNTYNLGKVETLIFYKKHKLEILFLSEHNNVIDIFKANETSLIKSINSIGIKNIDIRYKVKTSKQDDLDIFRKTNYTSFDAWV